MPVKRDKKIVLIIVPADPEAARDICECDTKRSTLNHERGP
jgi:hypothetical protein